MADNTTYVRNIKKYLLAALYNAPATINSHYSSLVQHDMYGMGKGERGQMQEGVAGKSLALITDGAKMSEQVFERALHKLLAEMQKGRQPKIHWGK